LLYGIYIWGQMGGVRWCTSW